MIPKSIFSVLTVLIISTVNLYGAFDFKSDIDTIVIDEIVVTATRSIRGLYDLPVRVDLIRRESIAATPALSADDYLRSIPGVTISRGASFFGASTVSMRGLSNVAGRTLVLVDGVPVNKSDGGSVNWNAINPSDIGRIEVVKGPGSSIYGGNAMGGIINIISPLPVEGVSGSVSQSYGTFDSYNTSAVVSVRNSDLFFTLNGRYRQSDGYITAFPDDLDDYSVASFMDEYQFGGKVGYIIAPDQTIEASANYYSGKRGTGSSFAGYGFNNEDLAAPDGAFNINNGIYGRVNYRGTFSNNMSLNLTFYAQQENYQNIRESVRSNTLTRYDVESVRGDIGFLSSINYNFDNGHSVTAGMDIRHGSVDGADIYLTSSDEVLNIGKLNRAGLYIQDEFTPENSPFSFLVGLRFDFAKFYDGEFVVNNPTGETSFLNNYAGGLDEADFSAVSPRFSVQYNPDLPFRIYAGYSKGFRSPVLDDLTRTGRILGGMKLANPNLKPEYLQSIELGGDFFAGSTLTISPSVYYSQGRDFHAYIATGDSLILNNRLRPIRIMDNIGKVEIAGAEISALWKIVPGMEMVVSYSRVNSKIVEYEVFDSSLDEDLSKKHLVYQPKDQLNATFSCINSLVNFSASYNYKGSQWTNEVNSEEIESFNFFDLRLWKELPKGISAAINAHNIFDSDYIDSKSMIGPGRMITVELKFSF